MSRTTLRLALAIVLAIGLLLQPAAAAQGTSRLAGTGRSLLADLWSFFSGLLPASAAAASESRIQIDPNGVTADCDSRITIDPDGQTGCAAASSDSRITIDPNG